MNADQPSVADMLTWVHGVIVAPLHYLLTWFGYGEVTSRFEFATTDGVTFAIVAAFGGWLLWTLMIRLARLPLAAVNALGREGLMFNGMFRPFTAIAALFGALWRGLKWLVWKPGTGAAEPSQFGSAGAAHKPFAAARRGRPRYLVILAIAVAIAAVILAGGPGAAVDTAIAQFRSPSDTQ